VLRAAGASPEKSSTSRPAVSESSSTKTRVSQLVVLLHLHFIASVRLFLIRTFFKDSPKAQRLVRETVDKLFEQTHPDPYIQPYMPGGSLFMRNPAIPLEALFPEGIPEGISKRRLNIDMSNIPDDQPYADKCFVDSANKVYWIEK